MRLNEMRLVGIFLFGLAALLAAISPFIVLSGLLPVLGGSRGFWLLGGLLLFWSAIFCFALAYAKRGSTPLAGIAMLLLLGGAMLISAVNGLLMGLEPEPRPPDVFRRMLILSGSSGFLFYVGLIIGAIAAWRDWRKRAPTRGTNASR